MRVTADGLETRRAFWTGLGAGLLVALAAIAAGLAFFQQKGLTVHVSAAPMAAEIQQEVKSAVRRELPQALSAVKQDLPKRVAAEASRKLSEASFDVAGFKVQIPEAARAQVLAKLEEALKAGLESGVQPKDLDALADRLGDQAFLLVRHRITKALSGQRFMVKPWPWYSVPVTVIVD